MEAFGEALVVEPYLPTVLAAKLVSKNAAVSKRVLPAVVEGRMKLAFAYAGEGSRYDLSKLGSLKGKKKAVLGAPLADKLVVAATNGLFLVDAAEVKMKPYQTLDGMRAADIDLAGCKAELVSRSRDIVEEAVDFAAALVCAEAVGAMKFACDTTLEYLKTRKQFGVPIGTFQALQHRVVDMYISYEQAKSLACLACSKVDSSENAADRSRAVSAAKIKIADSARHISQEAVQLHGGMGMSEELKVSHTFRRLTAAARQFGDADHHLERFASL
ncbi:MAG TPA: acyl-CoA dehydrogenase, partial [Burkholderiales bacterium]|nr:acyl-CoA dehydrogenase [Burkholderiales bacterium]